MRANARTGFSSVSSRMVASLTPLCRNLTLYPAGSLVTLVATPEEGWHFIRWAGDVSAETPTLLLPMDRARTVQAVFGTAVRTLPVGSGTMILKPSSDIYPFGTTIRVFPVPDPGYAFALWGGDFKGNLNPLSFPVTWPNQVVSALFAPLAPGENALAVLPNGSGSVSIQPQLSVYTNGQTVRLTASPAGSFFYWSGDANGKLNPLTLTMDRSRVVTANFTGGDYPLRLSVLPGNSNLLQFALSSEPKKTFLIEFSTNLQKWAAAFRLTNTEITAVWTEFSTTNAALFYRAKPDE